MLRVDEGFYGRSSEEQQNCSPKPIMQPDISHSIDAHKGRMPVLFVGHGNPMNAIEENSFSRAWRDLGKSLPLPRAVAAEKQAGRPACTRFMSANMQVLDDAVASRRLYNPSRRAS